MFSTQPLSFLISFPHIIDDILESGGDIRSKIRNTHIAKKNVYLLTTEKKNEQEAVRLSKSENLSSLEI